MSTTPDDNPGPLAGVRVPDASTVLAGPLARVAVSSSADSIARRAMELIGRPDRAARDWFGTGAGRADHADEILTGAGLSPDEISDLRQREVVA